MKIIVVSTIHPFVAGGATLFVEWLTLALQSRGHEVETLLIPFASSYKSIPSQFLAMRMLDVSNHGDLLIAVRPPSYLVRHPRKVLWFIHHHRTAYDLWGTEYQDIPDSPEGHAYRDAIMHADNVAFQESVKIFCNSEIVALRLKSFNATDAQVLYPPLWAPERYRTGAYGDYFLYVSRIVPHKRQLLAVEALRYTRRPVKLVIAGRPDLTSQTYLEEIQRRVRDWNLEPRVSVLPRWITEEEKVSLYSDCLAGIYIPYDEDSYGYPTLEAHYAGKGVITAADSGGTRELIADGENGFVADAEPEGIASAMDQLYDDRELAKRMGAAGQRRIEALGIDWNTVVHNLTT
jgi:glycosyltransferase involved in cell wall biosynthesis